MPRKPYSLFKRKESLKDGRPIFYVRFRDEEGNLITKSSGLTSKTAAEAWAITKIKEGRVSARSKLTFGQYAEKWWVWGECEYIAGKLARGKSISRSYAETMRIYLTRHILPIFKNKRLAAITTGIIEGWFLSM
jgi:hypothetical protein